MSGAEGLDDVLASLREKFRVKLNERATELEHAIATGHRDLAQRLVHRTSGTAGSYGFAEISDAATEVDVALQSGDELSTLGEQLEALIDLMRAA